MQQLLAKNTSRLVYRYRAFLLLLYLQNSLSSRPELEKICQCPTKLLMLVDEVLDHQCQPIIYITLFENTHLKGHNWHI